jgi:hypothetical protein
LAINVELLIADGFMSQASVVLIAIEGGIAVSPYSGL